MNRHRWTSTKGNSSRQSRVRNRNSSPASRSEIYEDLLDEALQQTSSSTTDDRPLKKRKSQRDASEVIVLDDESSVEYARKEKEVVIIESSESQESEDDEDVEWDNVELGTLPTSEDITESQTSPIIREVTLTTTTPKPTYSIPIHLN